jgi:ferredoxin-NADP reductase
MAMIRSRAPDAAAGPMRLLYSVREPSALLYGDDLATAAAAAVGGVQVELVYTRTAPAGSARPPARVDRALLAEVTVPAAQQPTCYVCGPTPFVETVTDLLVQLGHEPSRIRTERFGPSGGRR